LSFAVSLILGSQRVLTVSPQNVIAFACYGTLKSSTAGPSDQSMNVVVCDANTLWDTHM